MTLHDRLNERANRTPPDDPAEVLAAARARAHATSTRRRQPALLAAAAAVLAVVALVGVTLAAEDGNDTVTVAGPNETDGTDTADPEADAPVVAERSGNDCAGLRSETVWADTDDTSTIEAPAGGTATYTETVTNEGEDSCSIVFAECPAPGALYTAGGEPAAADSVVCDAIGYPPEELPAGESRTETWTVPLTVAPGAYELRVPQRDGTLAALPISVTETIEACPDETVDLDQSLVFEQYVDRGDTTMAQLLFTAPDTKCTIRIQRSNLILQPVDSDEIVGDYLVETPRWYTTGGQFPVIGEAEFGPIDLPAAQYEGTITVELENGHVLAKPARLLVGDPTAPADSAATTTAPAPAETAWGPLAVVEGAPDGREALTTGTLNITNECVTLTGPDGSERLLVWPSEGTAWSPDARTINYDDGAGQVFLRDGDQVSFGGGGSSAGEDGRDGPAWVDSVANWESRPDPSCPMDSRWFVGALGERR